MKTRLASTKKPPLAKRARARRAANRLPFVKSYRDRHGKERYYFRRVGQPEIALPGEYRSPEFMLAYNRQLETAVTLGRAATAANQDRLAGSIGVAIAAYYNTNAWQAFAPSTQKMRRRILEKLRASIGGDQLKDLTKGFIVSSVLGPLPAFEANNWLKTLRGFLGYAVEVELLDADPSLGIKKQKGTPGTIHTWSDEEIAQYRRHHTLGTTARLALELLLNTVQRRSDAITLGPQHIRRAANGQARLFVQQKKTKMAQQDRALLIPILPELQAALDATPASGHLTFLVNAYGKKFTEAGFGMRFGEWCDEAGLPPECSSHGLRKATCCELLEAGCTPDEVIAWSGHRSVAELKPYIEKVNKERLAAAAGVKILAARKENRETRKAALEQANIPEIGEQNRVKSV